MSAGHDLFSVEGLILAFATCFAIHVAMVPLGLDALAHEAGHGLAEMFNEAGEAAPLPDPVPELAVDCHFHGGEMHCGAH